jgi:uncharacterized UBP type Zn finger protein
MTLDTDGMRVGARARLNGQAPPCEHLDISPVTEHGLPRCVACTTLGLTWTRLLACLTCGWVACSDESPGAHAREHYRETDHPVVAALSQEPPWRWCYVDERAV